MTTLDGLYPPTPRNVPRDITRPTPGYRLQVLLVLACLFLFLAIYIGLTVAAGYGVWYAVDKIAHPLPRPWNGRGRTDEPTFFYVLQIITCTMLFVFLIKGFFQRSPQASPFMVELFEKDQPKLFEFIRRLCAETTAPLPYRVYVTHEVNACVFFHQNFWSLLFPTRKNLLVGLGLVNRLNLTEFKAVLAHEFGHFSQNSMRLGGYVYTSNIVIGKLVYGRDWLDDLLDAATRIEIRIAIFAYAIKGVIWGLRKGLEGIFRAINFTHSAMSRKMEFNADLVAYSVSGSDAIVHALAKLDFAGEALFIAGNELFHAADHGLYTRDLFFHQTRTIEFLRERAKEPRKGEPPPLPENPAEMSQVFEPGDKGIPLMWSTHPSNFDREKNLKAHYIRSTFDERTSWLIIDNAEQLKEAVTRTFYKVVHQVAEPKMIEPEKVQAFIDSEHRDTTFADKYHGMYDGGFINPGELPALRAAADRESGNAAALEAAHASLYHEDVRARYQEFTTRQKDYSLLFGIANGLTKERKFKFRNEEYPAKEAKALFDRLAKELEIDQKWLESHDARMFKTHYAMAKVVGGELYREFLARYDFHLAIQGLVTGVQSTYNQVQQTLNSIAGQRNVEQSYFQSIVTLLAESREYLKDQLLQADRWTLPKLKNMDDVSKLGRFLCTKELPRPISPGETSLDGAWIQILIAVMVEVMDKGRRIQTKSMGAILILQDAVAEQWRQMQAVAAVAAPPNAEQSQAT